MESIYTLEEIEDVAKKFISFISDKKVIALHGNLGAGKTNFVQAICKQLNVHEVVSSPTFAIIHQYKTKSDENIFHLDLYRVKDEQEAIQAGVEECLYSGDRCFVEWPEKIFSLLPLETVQVFIEIVDSKTRKLVCKLP